jgi:hypothetical protein
MEIPLQPMTDLPLCWLMYRHPEVARIAQVVEQKLEALVAEATGTETSARTQA